jgi:hypothetical protein
MSVNDPKSKESVKANLDELQKRANELHQAFAHTWNARADTLKTIVSLSSASIVLSVTFSSSLRQLNAGATWRYLIISTFALFTLALVTAFLGLWFGIRVYKLPARVIDKRLEMNKALVMSSSQAEANKAIDKLAGDALQPVYKADNYVAVLYGISGLSFCVAIILLAVIGIVRLF